MILLSGSILLLTGVLGIGLLLIAAAILDPGPALLVESVFFYGTGVHFIFCVCIILIGIALLVKGLQILNKQ